MQPAYDALVIGTGFGGAVSACRLAQAGLAVAVLERGRRYPLGGFPRNWSDPRDGWLWSHEQGLFDLRPFQELMVVQSAGYGGGSLIYANVQLRAQPAVFARGWPSGYSRAELDPHYDLVAHMLEIAPVRAEQALGLPRKAQGMAEAAARLGRKAEFVHTPLAVDFSAPGVPHPNRFGVEQRGCTHCGECDIGCNLRAKNTLDLNYLALAERHGAQVRTRCEALRIEPVARGYRVSARDHAQGGAELALEAPRVFVCAGALGSTELLLRCRDEFRTLPRLGPALGRRFSGNGDFLAFAFGAREELRPSEGPTITTGIACDEPEGWFILEEGGYPRQIARLLALLDPQGSGWLGAGSALLGGAAGALAGGAAHALRRALGAAARGLLGDGVPPDPHGAVFLCMGRDHADGRLSLSPLGRQLHIDWDVASNRPLYAAQERVAAQLTRALGGRLALNPFWSQLRQPVSVHPLGGCPMADRAEDGVTDGFGEVHGYPGLYVLDGAALPAATGVNPSHTIAAVAERGVERAIRALPGRAGWSAPERAHAARLTDPLDGLPGRGGSHAA